MTAGLTPQAVERMHSLDNKFQAVVQVLEVKRIGTQAAQGERFRLVLSDGQWSTTAMLATQMNYIVKEGQIQQNTVVSVDEFIVNTVQNRKIVIILGMRILQHMQHKIGSPQVLRDGPPAGADGQAAEGASRINTPGHAQVDNPKMNNSSGPGGYGATTGSYAQQAPNISIPGGLPAGQLNPRNGVTTGASIPGGYRAGSTGEGYSTPIQTTNQPGGFGLPGNANRFGSNSGTFGGNNGASGYGEAAGGYGTNPSAYSSNARFNDNRGPVSHDQNAPRVVPISSLNPYQNRWTIKGRVTVKTDIKAWHNARGDGKLFSFDLLDANGGEIRAVAFNDTADKFFDMVEPGHVYLVSKGSLKPKRAQWNHTNSEYEITLESSSIIERIAEDDIEARKIDKIRYTFKKLAAVEEMPATNTVDVIGVVESVAPETQIVRRDGSEARKRSVVIKDDSQRSIEVTLWGSYATVPGDRLEMEADRHPILAIKSARVGDYNGKNLSTIGTSVVTVDPDIPEAGSLRHWYDKGGGAEMAVSALSGQGGVGRNDRRVTFSQIQSEGLGTQGTPEYVSVIGTVTFIRAESMSYPACTNDSTTNPGRPCSKKLIESGDGSWFCEKCGRNSQVEFRYIMTITANDHTGSSWLTMFNEAGQELLNGVTASRLKELENSDEFDAVLQEAGFKLLNFKLRIQEESYNDEQRVKTTVRGIAPVDFASESRETLKNIALLKSGQPIFQPLKPATGRAGLSPMGAPTGGSGYNAGGAVNGGYNMMGSGYGNPSGGGGYASGGGGGGGGGGYSNWAGQNAGNGGGYSSGPGGYRGSTGGYASGGGGAYGGGYAMGGGGF